MDRISDRHEGTLEGRLAPVDSARPATISVTIPAAIAAAPSCQHTAWMFVNLLARQKRIVERVVLDCPSAVPLAGPVVPLADRDADLRTALLHGAAAIGGVPVVSGQRPTGALMRFVIGPGQGTAGIIHVHGERWWGGISSGEMPTEHLDSPLPYGPYVAACLAAGGVFKAVRMAAPAAPPPAAFYSAWSLRAMASAPTTTADVGPHQVDGVELDVTLAGVGAVGSTWLHAIWATPGLTGRAVLADADQVGVDVTNLNRCPIFGQESIGKRKATEASRICSDAPITLVPHDGPVGDVDERPPFLISAVDTNTSRRAVQGLYTPQLLSASTHNLRAEVLRCDPSAGAPCISCFNPPEDDVPDADLRREFLAADRAERERLAADADLSLEEAERWAVEGTCSYATDLLLDQLRDSHEGTNAFAVGFVSVMAGTMLAAQTIRELDGGGALGGTMARAPMQFLDLLAPTNAPRRQQRDPACAMCDPANPATAIWVRRFDLRARTRPAGAVRGRADHEP